MKKIFAAILLTTTLLMGCNSKSAETVTSGQQGNAIIPNSEITLANGLLAATEAQYYDTVMATIKNPDKDVIKQLVIDGKCVPVDSGVVIKILTVTDTKLEVKALNGKQAEKTLFLHSDLVR